VSGQPDSVQSVCEQSAGMVDAKKLEFQPWSNEQT